MDNDTVQLNVDDCMLLIRIIELYLDDDRELPMELSQGDYEELSQLRDRLLFLADSQL